MTDQKAASWDGLTLEEWVILELEAGRGNTPEFQAAVRVYGREKLEKIWRDHKAKTARPPEGGVV
jgi:hypothetical protein